MRQHLKLKVLLCSQTFHSRTAQATLAFSQSANHRIGRFRKGELGPGGAVWAAGCILALQAAELVAALGRRPGAEKTTVRSASHCACLALALSRRLLCRRPMRAPTLSGSHESPEPAQTKSKCVFEMHPPSNSLPCAESQNMNTCNGKQNLRKTWLEVPALAPC